MPSKEKSWQQLGRSKPALTCFVGCAIDLVPLANGEVDRIQQAKNERLTIFWPNSHNNLQVQLEIPD